MPTSIGGSLHLAPYAHAKVSGCARADGHLYKAVSTALNLAPAQHTEESFKVILGGCTSVVGGLANLRNVHGDAHGQGRRSFKPAARHAEFAVNLAGALASFMVATHEARRSDVPKS